MVSLSKESDVLQTGAGAIFWSDQVLLSKNMHSRPGSRQKLLVRNCGVGVRGQNLILTTCPPRACQPQNRGFQLEFLSDDHAELFEANLKKWP